jgi:hypothetical protein
VLYVVSMCWHAACVHCPAPHATVIGSMGCKHHYAIVQIVLRMAIAGPLASLGHTGSTNGASGCLVEDMCTNAM